MIYLSTDDNYPIIIQASIHDYNVIKTLNKGQYSVVVLVEDINTHTKYAAKIISKQYINQRQEEYLIQNEINILRSLDHPNIIKFYQAFNYANDYGEYIVIITEYCENGDLFDYIMNNDINNEEMKKDIIFGLLKAVQYLHNKGIAHRDIKPENILLDSKMKPKLCDFGFTTYDIANSENKSKGTIRYSSPETILGKCVNQIKSDIWSVGMTMFVISEKCFPFDSDDEKYSMYQIVNGYIYINPDDNLQYIVGKCIRNKSEDRPNINEIIIDEYFDY